MKHQTRGQQKAIGTTRHSRKRVPIFGITTGHSEKYDKQCANQKLRKLARQGETEIRLRDVVGLQQGRQTFLERCSSEGDD